MKKVLLTFFAAALALSASAQIEKGTILVGASSAGGFESYDEDAGDFSQFGLGVKGGYFLADNFVLGLNLGFGKNSEVDDSEFGFGPFARYYFNGKIFVGAGVDIYKFGDYSETNIPLEVGYAAFITDAIAVEPALNFTKFGGDAEGSVFGLNVGFTLYLGRN